MKLKTKIKLYIFKLLRNKINDLTEIQFSNLRQIIYKKYNPVDNIHFNKTYINAERKTYIKAEGIACKKEDDEFELARQKENRLSILLATARVAKARYKFYNEYQNKL